VQGASDMSEATKKNLAALDKSIKDNTPLVRAQFKNAGIPSDGAIVFSAAKYFAALEKLAKQ
jgi:hypothetical protein